MGLLTPCTWTAKSRRETPRPCCVRRVGSHCLADRQYNTAQTHQLLQRTSSRRCFKRDSESSVAWAEMLTSDQKKKSISSSGIFFLVSFWSLQFWVCTFQTVFPKTSVAGKKLWKCNTRRASVRVQCSCWQLILSSECSKTSSISSMMAWSARPSCSAL